MKFSKWAKQRLRRTLFAEVPRTTLYTEKGPAVGTIWLSITVADRIAMIVKEVDKVSVDFQDGSFMSLKSFKEAVDNGDFVLVGCKAPVSYYTEI